MGKNDDDRSVKVVQLFAVATTVFVLVFLYMAKKLRDRKRVHGGDNCSDGSAVGATGTGSSSSSSSNNNNNVDGGGDSNHRDEDGSPPRLHKHQAVADVVELVIYPVKSCAGVSYDQLQLTKTGFWGDRLWMVVRPHKAADAEEASFSTTASKHTTLLRYKFLTQRECPRMALVQPKIESTTVLAPLSTAARSDRAKGLLHGIQALAMSAPGCRDILCPIIRAASPHAVTCHVTMHDAGKDDAVGVVDQGDEVADWLSSFLGWPHLRLVFRDPVTCERIVSPKYAVPAHPNALSFADGMQYLLTSRTSLAELNRRMPEGSDICTMDRFRPNIVVNRSLPFDEDMWREIKIGPSTERWSSAPTFFGVKHCTRCVMPTTNQNTGEQSGAFSEPLTTLRTFRRQAKDGKPLFGENLCHQEEWQDGVAPSVSVGDNVWLVARKKPGEIGGSKRKKNSGRTGGGGCVVC